MNVKNIFIGLGLCGLAVSAYVFIFQKNTPKSKEALYTIGILQTASHPALDAVRDGFIDEIKAQCGDKINFVINNGQGSVATIHTIAQQFHAKQDIDGIFAIATPAAQAMVSVEQQKPLFVAAVSVSPTTSTLFSGKNICGTSDMIDVRAEIEALHVLLPAAKTVGILYSTGEINAVSTAQLMQEELEKRKLTPVMIGITSEADIEPALASTLRKIDVLLAPTDNMVASAIALIADIVRKGEKPLVVSDNMLVKYGALMARGVDYYQSGRQTGALAIQVFMQGKKPHELSIIKAKTKEIYVNKEVAQALGIVIPDSIKKDVVYV